MEIKERKLFSIFSLKFSTYIRYALLVILMYGSFIAISIYIPYLVEGTVQNLIFWFFLLAIFDQVFIAVGEYILSDSLNKSETIKEVIQKDINLEELNEN